MTSLPAKPAAGSFGRAARRLEARFALPLVLAAMVALSGCVTPPKALVSTQAQPPQSGVSKILIMPPDIELSEVTAAGLLEPNAAWTKAGHRNVDAALSQALAASVSQVVRYAKPKDGSDFEPAHVQAVKLHNTVGFTVLSHKYVPALELPTKKDRFDWTLGKSVASLRKSYDADYALFVYLRDSFTSAGRVAAIMFAALFNVHLQGGTQVGFASLVDLDSGDVVWFNRLARQEGDLREPEKAQEAIDLLLEDVPL